jgi:hypothetical protein
MRRALLLSCAALAGFAAVPAVAVADAPPPDCATALVLAPNGKPAGCTTLSGPSNISGSYAARDLRLTLVTGSATATLTCAGDPATSATVTLDRPGTAAATVTGYGNCWVSLTATSDGTTAIAWNVTTYVFP